MRRRLRLLLVAGALGAGPVACSSDDAGGRSASPGSSTTTRALGQAADSSAPETGPAPGTQYVLLNDASWTVGEAIDYIGPGPFAEMDPDLDWYAEYEGPRIDNPDGSHTVPSVTLFGHTTGLQVRKGQLPFFDFRSGQLSGRAALIAGRKDGNPAVVIVELVKGSSVTLLSYDEQADLVGLAGRLRLVDERQWAAAGGRRLACNDRSCDPSES